jgi:hypothetical protein
MVIWKAIYGPNTFGTSSIRTISTGRRKSSRLFTLSALRGHANGDLEAASDEFLGTASSGSTIFTYVHFMGGTSY